MAFGKSCQRQREIERDGQRESESESVGERGVGKISIRADDRTDNVFVVEDRKRTLAQSCHLLLTSQHLTDSFCMYLI